MHLLAVAVNLTALAFGLVACAFLVVLVAAFDFLGVLITGLIVLVISYTVELEDGPAFLAMHRPDWPESPEELAAQRAGRSARLSSLKFAKLFGYALATVGALGFYFVQM